MLALYEVNIFGVNFADDVHILSETFLLFLIILAFISIVNIFSSHLLGLFNNVSVGWHVLGVAVIIALLVFVPDTHQDAGFVFGERINNTGFDSGSTGSFAFWFLVMPIGFLLTMYTQTGYDASAHTAEETRGAAIAAAQGVWRAVFFSALIGWFVLLALAVRGQRRDRGQRRRRRLDPDHHERAQLVGGEGGPPDRDDRADLLRAGRPDQRVANLVRVLARPRHAGLGAVPAR